MHQPGTTWRFPRPFWVANGAELCERAAYYGTFIALRTYLLRVVHLNDVQAGFVAGLFGALLYLFPFFTGATADRMGFRKALTLAFALLALGYGSLGFFTTLGPVLLGLLLIVVGGAFVKPVISGTVAKSSSEANRARAFSIFYMIVNIGSFTGKTIVAPIRIDGGGQGAVLLGGAAFVALLIVLCLYRPHEDVASAPRSVRETLRGMATAMSNLRFLALILITAGFWAIQGQLYASMPDYVIRMAGETYKPEWYANVNPLVVVLGVVGITHLVRTWKPESCRSRRHGAHPVLVAGIMASSHRFHGDVHVFGLVGAPDHRHDGAGDRHPGTGGVLPLPQVPGVRLQAGAARPRGPLPGLCAHEHVLRVALRVHLRRLHAEASSAPTRAPSPPRCRSSTRWRCKARHHCPTAYAHAHYLWYAFALVGAISFTMLLVYMAVTRRQAAAPAARQS